jgi:DEAD/DEAH box helicase domain-containing protein
MSVEAILEKLRRDGGVAGNLVAEHVVPAAEAEWAPFPAALDPSVVAAFRARGIERLYSHQAAAVGAALAGRDFVVTTPTASGKTLCYNAPVLHEAVVSQRASKALYLFPTKALSQDQVAELARVIESGGFGLHAATYDGDTPPSIRRTLREHGDILVTNPYMLHVGILPNHPKWIDFFRNLRTIVLDEVHTLAGVFGSHVANVLRRLLRICAHYGARPRIFASSASIANAAEHLRRLIGRDVQVIDRDGSPRGAKHFWIYNPPLLEPVSGLRANALDEARRLATLVAGEGHQSIFFTRSRAMTEVLTKYLKDHATEQGRDPERIRGYRGGYLPDLRREIEKGLRDGAISTVVSTNALELGIDIGHLDVCVMVGYPGSVASTWQQAGRAGRRGSSSLAVLIARGLPMDQYLALHPDYVFGGRGEHLAIDPDNLVVLASHVRCAAFELPFAKPAAFGTAPADQVAGILDYLAHEARVLHDDGQRYHWMAETYPAEEVSLDAADIDNVVVVDAERKTVLGELDRPSSITQVHKGAIYGHQGRQFLVEEFDHAGRRAYVREVLTDYYTEAETETEVRVLHLDETREHLPSHRSHRGEVHVVTTATVFKKIRFYTRENVGAGDIDLPPEEMETDAWMLVLEPAAALRLRLSEGHRSKGWRGLGKLLRQVVPLFVRCDLGDLGWSAELRSAHFAAPAITLWDDHPDGVHLSAKAYELEAEVLRAALSIVRGCACEGGCPGCVGPRADVGPDAKSVCEDVLACLVEGAWPAPRMPSAIA